MADKTLNDLFHETLRDIYYAECKILKALPKMARNAQSEQLKNAFLKHRDETEGQVERLQQVFEIIGKNARGKTCAAIEGIVEEAEEIMDEFKGTLLSMPACWPPPRLSSIMKSAATERLPPGHASWA